MEQRLQLLHRIVAEHAISRPATKHSGVSERFWRDGVVDGSM